MKSKEFALSIDAAKATRSHQTWIKSLFSDVQLQFDQSSSTSSARTQIEWLTLFAPTEESIEKAKNYITSLTSPGAITTITSTPQFKGELLKDNSKLLKEFERSSSGVIICMPNSDCIKIQGVDELTITIAKSLLDDEQDKFKTSSKTSIIDPELIELCESVKQFGLKLGYNGDDIREAAEKCATDGKIVNANTLLQELVKRIPHKLKDTILKDSNLNEVDEKLFVDIAHTIAEVTTAQTTTASSVSMFCDSFRDVIIDGSNVAMCHGHKEVFSCRGIQIAVDWFKQRGHENIVVFVPQWRLEAPKGDSPIVDQEILTKLHKEKILVFTPSRKINGRRIVCYDDRYIVKHASECDGIIVSNDNFRDLMKENPEYKTFIEQRLLMYSFVRDKFMPPDDPLGRMGPTLNEFLKKGSNSNRPCPYKNKCTYGSKCKFYHPEKEVACDTTKNLRSAPISSYSVSLSSGSHQNTHRIPYDEQRVPSMPMTYKSCGAELKERENNYLNQHEIVAKGYTSVPPDFLQKHNLESRDSQQQQLRHSSMYPQQRQQTQSPQYYQPSHVVSHPTHTPTRSHSQQYYVPSYSTTQQNQSYSLHEQSPKYPSQQQHMYQPQASRPMVSPYQSIPSHHMNYQPAPAQQSASTNPGYSVMPGYIDPRQLNQYYGNCGGQTQSMNTQQYMVPLQMTVDTPVMQERHANNTNYMLRSSQPSHTVSSTTGDSRFQMLIDMFPNRLHTIQKVLHEHSTEMDLNRLASFVLADSN